MMRVSGIGGDGFVCEVMALFFVVVGGWLDFRMPDANNVCREQAIRYRTCVGRCRECSVRSLNVASGIANILPSREGFAARSVFHVRFPEFQALNGIQAFWIYGSLFRYQSDERQYVRAGRIGYFQTFDNSVAYVNEHEKYRVPVSRGNGKQTENRWDGIEMRSFSAKGGRIVPDDGGRGWGRWNMCENR